MDPTKIRDLDQFTVGIYLNVSKTYGKLLPNELYLRLYYFSNDTEIFYFWFETNRKLDVTI